MAQLAEERKRWVICDVICAEIFRNMETFTNGCTLFGFPKGDRKDVARDILVRAARCGLVLVCITISSASNKCLKVFLLSVKKLRESVFMLVFIIVILNRCQYVRYTRKCLEFRYCGHLDYKFRLMHVSKYIHVPAVWPMLIKLFHSLHTLAVSKGGTLVPILVSMSN